MNWQPNQEKAEDGQGMAAPGYLGGESRSIAGVWQWAAFVAVAYLLAAQISLSFIIQPEGIAVFWLASGVSLSALVLTPRRYWVVILLVVYLVNLVGNLYRGYALPVSAGFALANVAEPLLGASLLRFIVGERINLERLFHALAWILAGATLSSALGALIGAATATLAFPDAAFAQVWQLWWIDDFIGILVAGSLILTFSGAQGLDWPRVSERIHLRSVLLFILLCLVSGYVFTVAPGRGLDLLASPYLVFPIVLWMALQCGAFGAAVGGLVVTLVSVWGMINGLGPFVEADGQHAAQALAVQLFLAVLMMSSLLLASVLGERNAVLSSLQAAEADLKHKLQFERLLARISRDIVNYPVVRMDTAIDAALETLGGFFAVDRVILAEFSRDPRGFDSVREWHVADVEPIGAHVQVIDRERVPWMSEQLFAGHCVVIEDRDAMPQQAAEDRRLLAALGDRSLLLAPIFLEGRLTAVIGFATHRGLRRWPDTLIEQAQMIGQALAGAVSRRRQDEILDARLQQRTAELSALNEELQAFSYSVSHDLRAPLRRVDGYSQMLEEDCADSLDDNGSEHLARIRSGVRQMDSLIEDLLQLSVITRRELERRTVNLSSLAEKILGGLREGEPERVVEVRIQPTDDVEGDAGLLAVLLENLLANAWKFTAQRAEPVIEFAQTSVDGVRAFYVRDNGAGFDMAFADKLFGAFQRLHNQAEYTGTGIGLATARRVVSRHGGSIWAEARLNEGAVFYFTLGTSRGPAIAAAD